MLERTRMGGGRSLWLPALMVVAFAGSRLAFAAAGVRFDAGPIEFYWQYLDRPLLEHELWRSVLYLHSQPPAFNLFLGAVLQTLGAPAFHAVFVGLGLAGSLLSFAVMRRLGVSRWAAFALSTALMLSPAWVLFESWLFYDLPVLVLLLAAAYALLRHASAEGDRAWLAVFCGALLLLSLTRSLFHFAWIGAVAAVVVPLASSGGRMAGALAATMALAALPCVKNEVLFGKFTPSTWTGMNLANVIQARREPDELRRLAASGAISAVSSVPPFSPLASYPVSSTVPAKFAGVAALSQPSKVSGHPNYNHFAYIAVSDAYLRDALALLKERPLEAVRAFGNGLDKFMRPASVEVRVQENRRAIDGYDSAWNRIVFGLVQPGPEKKAYPLLILGTIVALAFGAWFATARRALLDPTGLAKVLAARFMMVAAAWVVLIGNAFERGENFRFRYYLGPFALAFLGLAAQATWRRFHRIRSVG